MSKKNKGLKKKLKNLSENVKGILDKIDAQKLPPPRPRVIESTDAGSGVGSNNFHVRFRDAEIALLHNSTIRTRIHLATDDQGQNEAERTNSYIGKLLSSCNSEPGPIPDLRVIKTYFGHIPYLSICFEWSHHS